MRESTSFGVMSLFPEGDNRVDTSCSKSRNIARHKGHGKKHGRDGGKCYQVGGLDSIEDGAQSAEEQERQDDSYSGPNERHSHSLLQDHTQDSESLSSQGGTNAYFLGSLADGVGDNSIHSDGS